MASDAGVDARLIGAWISGAASIATLIVVAITAYAALRQMRHMRSGNQVAALLPLIAEYRSPEVSESLNYVLSALASDLRDPQARSGVTAVPATGPARKAMKAINFYESVGAMVCARVLDLELVMRYFILPSDMWSVSQDYVALSRRSRGPEVFENFEAMVALEQRYAALHGTSLYPKGLPHVPAREAAEFEAVTP